MSKFAKAQTLSLSLDRELLDELKETCRALHEHNRSRVICRAIRLGLPILAQGELAAARVASELSKFSKGQ